MERSGQDIDIQSNHCVPLRVQLTNLLLVWVSAVPSGTDMGVAFGVDIDIDIDIANLLMTLERRNGVYFIFLAYIPRYSVLIPDYSHRAFYCQSINEKTIVVLTLRILCLTLAWLPCWQLSLRRIRNLHINQHVFRRFELLRSVSPINHQPP